MATFTLPYELRFLAWDNQTLVYNLMFAYASSTLKDFGANPKNLGADIGMTAVLHTHNRRLDCHPHIHVIVPGGGVDKAKKQWKKKKNKYLFNEFALAKVFRARFLDALNKAGLSVPNSAPRKWVVDCTHVGKGLPALKYLSRYLYRGVIPENNIVSNQDGNITFKYVESRTGKTRYRTLKGPVCRVRHRQGRLFMACLATRFTQRLSSGQRLWLFAWQRQKAVVSGSVGFKGFDSSLCITIQTGL
jgi:hypothetical protein